MPWVVGRTKVFIKSSEDQEILERMLANKRLNSILLLQNWIRSVLNRRTCFYLFSLIGKLHRSVRNFDEEGFEKVKISAPNMTFLDTIVDRAEKIMEKIAN